MATAQAITIRVNQVMDRVFADFSKRQGVPSIREYEERHAEFEQNSREEKLKFASKHSRVQEQVSPQGGRC